MLLRKSKRQRGTQFDYNRGIRNDASLVPPIRQTASIFKQPVTVIRSADGKVRTDFKHGPQDKPKQVRNFKGFFFFNYSVYYFLLYLGSLMQRKKKRVLHLKTPLCCSNYKHMANKN